MRARGLPRSPGMEENSVASVGWRVEKKEGPETSEQRVGL